MTTFSRKRSARYVLSVLLTLIVSTACSDGPTGPVPDSSKEIGVVVNSQDRSLTIFSVADTTAPRTIGVGADGSPVTLAVRGRTAVVPLGVVPAVAVVDLSASTLLQTVALPEGSGATGAAFLNDSVALVANPNLNTVSPVNVRTGQRGTDVPVGTFPQAVVAANDTAWVLNAELGPDFSPEGPGAISVVAGMPLHVVATITLSGTNPGAAAFGSDGHIYVIDSGSFGHGNGALSVVDRGSNAEVQYVEGFGDFPGSIVVDGAGRAYVGGFGVGLLVWDTATRTFLRSASDPVSPGGTASVSGVGVDAEGRVYALEPNCQAPSRAFRLGASYEVQREIPVGICPFGIAFTDLPEAGA